VVLLYRQSPAHEWMPVDQYREGLWSVGYLFVNELKKGEYTLAAWDLQIVGTEDREADKTRQTISLIPNPASDSVIISWSFPNARELNVTHASGTNQLTRNIAGSAQTNINLAGWAQGTYVVSLTGFDGTILSQTKLVVK
jgi:hypothetical protein